ncbi:MAG: translation initiation factor IF-2B subunit alpha, partial [Thermococcus sp.]
MLPPEVKSVLEELRAERIRGASWMARQGAEAYLILADLLEGDELRKALIELRHELPRINPTMASLYNLSRFIPVTDNPLLVKSRAEEFLRLIDEAKKTIGNIGSELIEDG